MKKYVVGALIVIVGLLILFAPFGFARVCFPKADGSFMKCHWMGEAVKGIGIAMAVLAAVFLILRNSVAAVGIAASNIVLGILALLMPLKLIGTCKMSDMHCNLHTKPAILLVAGLYTLISCIYVFANAKSLKSGPEALK